MMAPTFEIWVKQCGIWHMPFVSNSPSEANDYAFTRIVWGNNVERVEVRDKSGVLNTFFDSSWPTRSNSFAAFRAASAAGV
jgi:hypothetical protein